MPVQAIDLPHDQLAAAGMVKEALRQVEKELAKVTRQAAKALSVGKNPDIAVANRILELQGHSENYQAKLKANKAVQKATKESVFKTVADLFNTHNPHGQLKQLFHGRVRASNVQSVGEFLQAAGMKLGGAGYARAGKTLASAGTTIAESAAAVGPAAMVLTTALMGGLKVWKNHIEANVEQARNELEHAAKVFQVARANRYNSSADADRYIAEMRKAQIGDIAVRDDGVVGNFWRSVVDPTANVAREGALRRHGLALAEFKHNNAYLDSGRVTQAARPNVNEWAVRREMEIGKRGLAQYVYDQTIGRVLGHTQDLAEQIARDVAMKRVEGMRRRVEDRQRELEDDPLYQSMRLDQARQLNAVYNDRVSRYHQWNAY